MRSDSTGCITHTKVLEQDLRQCPATFMATDVAQKNLTLAVLWLMSYARVNSEMFDVERRIDLFECQLAERRDESARWEERARSY
jgi:hypothetical protein